MIVLAFYSKSQWAMLSRLAGKLQERGKTGGAAYFGAQEGVPATASATNGYRFFSLEGILRRSPSRARADDWRRIRLPSSLIAPMVARGSPSFITTGVPYYAGQRLGLAQQLVTLITFWIHARI